MPSANARLGGVHKIYQGDLLSAVQIGSPLQDIRRMFRENIHEANRIAKRELEKAVRRSLSKGVEGETYHPDYAARKNRDPRAEGGPYSSSGPVDFRYSGKLWDQITGRGRAKPSENTLQFWIGLANANKSRPESAPGSFSTYGQLADHLKRNKSGTTGNPFKPDPNEEREIIKRTAQELLSGNA